jgi:SAM-dependent methyltransferase
MAAKIVLARVPVGHGAWFKAGIYRHGQMQDISYAREVFAKHLKFGGLETDSGKGLGLVLELGPGESLFTALLAKAYGFRGSILVDVGHFAIAGADRYRELANQLVEEGAPVPDLSDCMSTESILDRLNACYLTGGLASLREIPDSSVDLIFSQAVVEHLRKHEFESILKELRRILKPGGVSTHVIDFKDHLQASLHNLRFSDAFWESDFISSSGFYTNRLRSGEVIGMFRAAGFEVEVLSQRKWSALPVSKEKLAPQFWNMPEEWLLVSGIEVRLS